METKAVKDLKPGDVIDLEGDPFADPDLCPDFEYEHVIVAGGELETATCYRLDIEGCNSVGFPSDHMVPYVRHDAEYAAAVG